MGSTIYLNSEIEFADRSAWLSENPNILSSIFEPLDDEGYILNFESYIRMALDSLC